MVLESSVNIKSDADQNADQDPDTEVTTAFIKINETNENQVLHKKSTKRGIHHQILLTTNVSLVMISLAQILIYPALFLPEVRNETDILYMNAEMGSWYTSVNSLSSMIGSLIAGFMMDRYGRRIALATPLIPLIASWIATALSQDYISLFVSRIVLGFCGGFAPPVCQIYLAECADAEFRDVTMNVGYVTLSTGMLLTFALGVMMDWRKLAWCGIILPIISLSALFVLPETPLWLARHEQIDKAYENLFWLRGDANIARNELNQYLTRLNQEKSDEKNQKTSWKDFTKPSVIKPIVIIFTFILIFNVSGTYLIFQYALDIISKVKLTISAKNMTVLLSAVRLVVTIVFCWLFMHVARRKIYMIAGIGSTLSTFCLAGYLMTSEDSPTTYDLLIASTLLLIYVAVNTGFMIAPGFMTGELLPARIRGRLAGYIYTFFSIITFVLNKVFPFFNEWIGLVGILFVFGVGSLLTAALIYFMVPETKGKSLLQIEDYFQQNGWIYRAKRESLKSDSSPRS